MTAWLTAVHELAGDERRVAIADMAALHATAFAPAWSAAEIAALLDHAGAVAFLARSDGAAVGFALARAVADEAEVLTIVTGLQARRRGYGRSLLDALVTALAARGTATLYLEVAEDNGAARALYARAGFVDAGRRKAYYPRAGAAPADAVLLKKAFG